MITIEVKWKAANIVCLKTKIDIKVTYIDQNLNYFHSYWKVRSPCSDKIFLKIISLSIRNVFCMFGTYCFRNFYHRKVFQILSKLFQYSRRHPMIGCLTFMSFLCFKQLMILFLFFFFNFVFLSTGNVTK